MVHCVMKLHVCNGNCKVAGGILSLRYSAAQAAADAAAEHAAALADEPLENGGGAPLLRAQACVAAAAAAKARELAARAERAAATAQVGCTPFAKGCLESGWDHHLKLPLALSALCVNLT